MHIFMNAMGLLFINSIDDAVGELMKIWIKNDNHGFRFFDPTTKFRP
jgi:hypothetical protein